MFDCVEMLVDGLPWLARLHTATLTRLRSEEAAPAPAMILDTVDTAPIHARLP